MKSDQPHKQLEPVPSLKSTKPKFSGKQKAACTLLIGVIIAIGGVIALNHAQNISTAEPNYNTWENAGTWTTIGGIVIGAIAIVAIKSACPRCGAVASREQLNREVLGSRKVEGTRREVTTHYDSNGKKTGTSEKDVPHTYTEFDIRIAYRCNTCCHTWSVDKTERK